MKISELIEKLQKAKEQHGDVDVMAYHGYGDYTSVCSDEAYMEVIPASKIYPEDKHFVIKVGEDDWE